MNKSDYCQNVDEMEMSQLAQKGAPNSPPARMGKGKKTPQNFYLNEGLKHDFLNRVNFQLLLQFLDYFFFTFWVGQW